MTTVRTESDEIPVVEAPPLAGLRFRHYRGPVDHPAMADINTAVRHANGGLETVTAATLDADYAHLPNCDLDRDFIGAELHGSLVGYGRVYWTDRNDGSRAFESICMIDPRARGLGIGTAIHAWQTRRSAELRASLRDDRPAVWTAYAYGTDAGARVLLQRAGFGIVRRFCELNRNGFDGIPELPLPDGLAVRAIDRSDTALVRQVWDAGAEAFAEHWGESATDSDDEQFAAFLASPSFQPELWQVAFAGDEVAGHILNYLDPPEANGARTGWTESIAVRVPYRRRGLARALLARSLATVRDAGATRAALGVDTENVNHALDLYESLGFVVVAEQFEFHRRMDRSEASQ